MIDYTRGKIARLLKIDFVRFCMVGGTGFFINLAILSVLHSIFNAPIFIAQLIGAEVALFSNFLLHHHWTYKHHRVIKEKHSLIVQFHLTSWPAILGSATMVSIIVKMLSVESGVALVISSVIALMWNFLWSKYIVWKDVSGREVKEMIQ